jgi:hypothetical protein
MIWFHTIPCLFNLHFKPEISLDPTSENNFYSFQMINQTSLKVLDDLRASPKGRGISDAHNIRARPFASGSRHETGFFFPRIRLRLGMPPVGRRNCVSA